MKRSESIASLAAALAKFQGECPNPKNTDINPQFRHKYAPMDVVVSTIKPFMAKYGLSFMQFDGTGAEPETVTVTTLIMHESGEWIESDPLQLPAFQVRKDNVKEYSAQGAGIALSYGRRYQLSAILGLASEDDDDAEGLGQQSGGYRQQYQQPSQAAQQPAQTPSQSQGNNIKNRMQNQQQPDPARVAHAQKLWEELQGGLDGFDDYVKKNGLEVTIKKLEERKKPVTA